MICDLRLELFDFIFFTFLVADIIHIVAVFINIAVTVVLAIVIAAELMTKVIKFGRGTCYS